MQQRVPKWRKKGRSAPISRERWGRWVPDGEMQRRAGGRTGYNSWRRDMALLRRQEMARAYYQALDRYLALHPYALRPWGWQKRYAAAIGVSPSTVCRDVKRILAREE